MANIGDMEWTARVEELLHKNLKVGKELKEFKTESEEKLREDCSLFDQCLDASSNELKRLQEESDGLFAESMGFSEEVQELEDAQKKQFSLMDKEIKKKGLEVAQLGSSLTRLRDILTTKNDSDRQLFTPPVTFTLDNFQERKHNNEIWLSPYFYSHKYGYKMQLKVYPKGTGEAAGTHVSMFVVIVPGEFDDLLMWPFCGTITVHLINQRKNGSNMVQTICYTLVNNLQYRQKPSLNVDDELRMGWGTFKLVALTELGEGPETGLLIERPVYLKDDCLSFCVWNITVFSQHH